MLYGLVKFRVELNHGRLTVRVEGVVMYMPIPSASQNFDAGRANEYRTHLCVSTLSSGWGMIDFQELPQNRKKRHQKNE